MINRSCESCRVKKLRCHGGEPCGPCRRSNSECVRIARKKKTMRKRAAAAAAAQVGIMHAQSLPTPVTTTSLGESSQRRLDNESLQWLNEARDAIGFSYEACRLLLTLSFHYRALPYLHGCVDVDVLLSYTKRLFDVTDNGITVAPSTRAQVMLVLFALSGTMIFTPPNAGNAEPLKMAVAFSPRRPGKQKLDPGACQRDMLALAMRWLQACETPSLEAVQSVVVATLHECDDAAIKETLFDRAVRWSLQLDLHQSSRDKIPSRAEEVRVRTWWFLVTRSWLAAPKQWSYVLHPTIFTTRKPLDVELDDLDHGLDVKTLQQRNVHRFWTASSYSLSLLALAETVRGLVDLRNERSRDSRRFQDDVVAAFDKLQTSLPWVHATNQPFSADAAVKEHDGMSLAHAIRIEMERWLLHQQLFHCFLALHNVAEPTIGAAEMIPSSCTTLAHQMIDSMDRYSRHCSVLAASRLPIHTLTTAAIVIAVDTINHGRHIDGKHVDDFVKVAIAAGKARRLSNETKAKWSRRSLLRLESLVEFWRENLPQDVALEAVMDTTGALMEVGEDDHARAASPRPASQLQQHVQTAVDESYDYMRAWHAPATQLWDSNETWRKALRWDYSDDGGGGDAAYVDPRHETLQLYVKESGAVTASDPSASTHSEHSTNPTPVETHAAATTADDLMSAPSWQADYSASMVPGLAALLPAFQFDKDDADWWDTLSLSLQGGSTIAATAM